MLGEILGAIGYIGDAIDKPGRAVRGLLAGRPDEAAAAIPFSDSLGITDKSRSTSGRDLLDALGVDVGDGLGGNLAGFASEVATDPMTLLGGGLGLRLGRAAERAAVARGPQFPTTANDLARMIGGSHASQVDDMTQATARMGGWSGSQERAFADSLAGSYPDSRLLASEGSSDVLSRLHPESKFLGSGAEGMAFKTPDGTVTRIGEVMPGTAGRPIAPNVAQPVSTTDFANNLFRVETGIPYADHVGDMRYWTTRNPADSLIDNSGRLDAALRESRLARQDRHLGNIGTVGDTPMVIDPGDIKVLPGFSGGFQQVGMAREPGAMMNALLNALGSSETIQAGLDPRYRAMLGVGGAGAGAATGAFGRAFGQ